MNAKSLAPDTGPVRLSDEPAPENIPQAQVKMKGVITSSHPSRPLASIIASIAS